MQFEQWLDAGRNSSSNRALAPAIIRAEVLRNPYIPTFVQKTKGMVGGAVLEEDEQKKARDAWLWARDRAIEAFDMFEDIPAHKQHRNRLLGPFQYITVVYTANEHWWKSFFELRDHPDAQPDISLPASMAHELYRKSVPTTLYFGEWHKPYIVWEDYALNTEGVDLRKVSAARCARTSYLRQNELQSHRSDLQLYNDLATAVPKHDSPRDHVATPIMPDTRAGNLIGWCPMRHWQEAS